MGGRSHRVWGEVTARTPLRSLVALALGLGLTAAACSGGVPEQRIAGPDLLQGEVATLDGGSVDLTTLQDQDVVFWFWAPW